MAQLLPHTCNTWRLHGIGINCLFVAFTISKGDDISGTLNQSINQSINQSNNQSIDRSIDRSIDQSINQSINRHSTNSVTDAFTFWLYTICTLENQSTQNYSYDAYGTFADICLTCFKIQYRISTCLSKPIKSSTDSGILRKLTNVEIILRAWTKSLKRTKLYFDD